jgi:DNA-binding GntR family transcriptional regulator
MFAAAEALPSKTVREHLVSALRDAIIAGRFKPGDRLNESKLAREYSVSRIPVREALQILHEQGLLMSSPRRGMFVNDLSEEDCQRINSLRIILEAEALRLCRLRLTDECENRLVALLERMELWHLNSDAEAAALDLEFHRTIWAQSGNHYLEKVLNSVVPILFVHQALECQYGVTMASEERTLLSLKCHRQLLEVIQGKSKLTPEQAILAHLKLLYNNPERFSSLAANPAKAVTTEVQLKGGEPAAPDIVPRFFT